MDVKTVVLKHLDRETMRRVLVMDLGHAGVDHRTEKAMRDLLSRDLGATPKVMLEYLNDFKAICDELGISSKGGRWQVIDRIVACQAPAAASSLPPNPPQPKSTAGTQPPRHPTPPDVSVAVTPNPDPFVPFPHQKSAWEAMERHFLVNDGRAGIVVVPTGGGKTEIASRWLLRHHVSGGGRVLWLAHRRSLLLQAFNNFVKNAHLATPLKRLRLARISAEDARWPMVSAEHQIVFSSVQSAAAEGAMGFINRFAHDSKGPVFVVVDEAHHAAAPSYQRVLDLLKGLGASVLGLTATPVRMDEEDERRLWNAFDRQCICEIFKSELIHQGILAAPRIYTVETEVEPERDFTAEDHAHLSRFGELAPTVLERLARNAKRNRLIVEHYTANAVSYRKTIVFAADILHVQMLALEFKQAGVEADYVDYTRGDCQGVMEAFREQAAPVVLVNVEMLTEGYDAPMTETVFIARPTRSDALLSQMVGRALRGPKARGTPVANLVTFVDTWRNYHVLDTRVVVAEGDVGEPSVVHPPRPPVTPIAAELVLEAYKLVNSVYKGHLKGVYACMPYAWYVWEEEQPETDAIRRSVLVFENQKEGYEQMHVELIDSGTLPADVTENFAHQTLAKYFADVNDPLPSVPDLVALLNAYGKQKGVGRHRFHEKDAFNPDRLAPEMRSLPVDEIGQRLQAIVEKNPLCRWVYQGDLKAFMDDVWESMWGRPKAATPPVIERIMPDQKLRGWPAGQPGYDLGGIWDAVTGLKQHFPQGPPQVSGIRFSEKPLRSTWGFYRHNDRSAVLSSTLNSPDIPLFVVEFMIYHEALHAEMTESGHSSEFRRRERGFVPSAEAVRDARRRGVEPTASTDAWRVLADQFLDTFHSRFIAEAGQRPLYY